MFMCNDSSKKFFDIFTGWLFCQRLAFRTCSFVAWGFCIYTANIYWERVWNWQHATFCFKFKPQRNDSNKFGVHWSFTRRWFKADLLLVLMVCIPDEPALLFRSLTCLELNSRLFHFIDSPHTMKEIVHTHCRWCSALKAKQRCFLCLNYVQGLEMLELFFGKGAAITWGREPQST